MTWQFFQCDEVFGPFDAVCAALEVKSASLIQAASEAAAPQPSGAVHRVDVGPLRRDARDRAAVTVVWFSGGDQPLLDGELRVLPVNTAEGDAVTEVLFAGRSHREPHPDVLAWGNAFLDELTSSLAIATRAVAA